MKQCWIANIFTLYYKIKDDTLPGYTTMLQTSSDSQMTYDPVLKYIKVLLHLIVTEEFKFLLHQKLSTAFSSAE